MSEKGLIFGIKKIEFWKLNQITKREREQDINCKRSYLNNTW